MESPNTLFDENYSKKRNRKKSLRAVLQFTLLFAAIAAVVISYLLEKPYAPYTEQSPTENGFIAISYFGVQKTEGSQSLISEKNLRAHLQALKNQGYETITTDDIYEFYHNGKPLPEKSLYLMFEDGRRDTAIFSTPIIKDLNYHATMFTYPEKFDRGDTKFLLPDDLKDLVENNYWDIGTNGYRLFYINVFDRYDNYLGEMDPLMFNQISPYLGRKYNHYLMDYIRDKDFVPKESYDRMRNRISYDYEKLDKVYKKDLGYVPKVSVLMHANTSGFGNNAQVSAVNEYWLRKLFEMNFNREGYCLNVQNSSIYDLTRMQPQAWWPVNHLLMRIKYDTKKDVVFNTGEAERFNRWNLEKGAVEFKDEKVFLTSLPKNQGIVRLNNSSRYRNLRIDTELMGNKAGTQSIYLRADKNMSNYIAVEASGAYFFINEIINGQKTELAKISIDEVYGKKPISVDEDKHNAELTALEAFTRYAPSTGTGQVYINRLKEKTKEEPQTVAEGAQVYVPTIRNNEKGDYKLSIELDNNILKLYCEDKKIAEVEVNNNEQGDICLSSAWTGVGWEQRNLDDDVYDAVYKDLVIKELNSDVELFTAKYSGWEKIKYNMNEYGNIIIDWFVHHL